MGYFGQTKITHFISWIFKNYFVNFIFCCFALFLLYVSIGILVLIKHYKPL